MQNVYKSIDKLVYYAEKNLGLEERNRDYVRNAIFNLFDLDAYDDRIAETENFSDVDSLKSPEKLVA